MDVTIVTCQRQTPICGDNGRLSFGLELAITFPKSLRWGMVSTPADVNVSRHVQAAATETNASRV